MERSDVNKLKEFCKMANINCKNISKIDIINQIKDYLDRYKYAPRYLRGLSVDDKYLRKFEIKYNLLKEKKLKEKGLKYKQIYKSTEIDKLYKNTVPKYSKYTIEWNKKYPDCKNIECKSKISGVPLNILKQVENKGAAAWRGGSHRPGATRENWMVSRVNSFLLCGKTWQFPDHLLAKEALKSKKVKNFWKNCDFDMLGIKTRSR